MTRFFSRRERSRHPVLLIDHRDIDQPAVATAIRNEGFAPRTLPNVERAVFHLSQAEPYEGVLVPIELGTREIAKLLEETREHRGNLPVVLLQTKEESIEPISVGPASATDSLRLVRLAPTGFSPGLRELLDLGSRKSLDPIELEAACSSSTTAATTSSRFDARDVPSRSSTSTPR